jgi:hypothetical protein
MKKSINAILAFLSWALLMGALDQGEWVLSLAMMGTLAACFLIEADKI